MTVMGDVLDVPVAVTAPESGLVQVAVKDVTAGNAVGALAVTVMVPSLFAVIVGVLAVTVAMAIVRRTTPFEPGPVPSPGAVPQSMPPRPPPPKVPVGGSDRPVCPGLTEIDWGATAPPRPPTAVSDPPLHETVVLPPLLPAVGVPDEQFPFEPPAPPPPMLIVKDDAFRFNSSA